MNKKFKIGLKLGSGNKIARFKNANGRQRNNVFHVPI